MFAFFNLRNNYIINYDLHRTRTNNAWSFAKSFDGIIDGFSIMAFAFMTHHNSFLLYFGMKTDANINNWKKVTKFSVSIATVFSATFGIILYLEEIIVFIGVFF